MISKRTILRSLAGLTLSILVLFVIGWLVFVPSAKEAGYEFVLAWGEKGTKAGQFNDPTGIAVAGGKVFVADSRNGRIQVFDLEGNYMHQFGRAGEAKGELGRPMNLQVHEDELYVPEYFNDRIQVFDIMGNLLRYIGGSGNGPGGFNAPGGLAIGSDGDLYVADFYNHRVQELRPDGAFVRQWGTTGQTGHGIGEFYYPTDVALDQAGNVYIADGYGNRVQVFEAGGDFLRKWGGPLARGIYGPFNGWITTVTSIASGPDGNIFVADFYNDRVQKFTADGQFLTAFGESGDGPGQFGHAMAVDVAADGSVFVTDFLNNRIQKWRPRR